MGDVREELIRAVQEHTPASKAYSHTIADKLVPVVDAAVEAAVKRHVVQLLKEKHAARAQALRDAAEHLPEVGDVLRGMAAREVGGDE